MDKLPKIAVLLAAYNGEQYIEEQLDSILRQKNVDLSIIISVDKSNDSTLSIVNNYAKRFSNITILPYGQCYGSAGKNFTRLLCEVDLSHYQFVSFADQDDVWLPNKLECAVYAMTENNADGYSSNVTAFWDSGKHKLIKKSAPQVEFDYLFESPGPGCSFLLSVKLIGLIQSHLQSKLAEGKAIWMHDWYCYSFARFHCFSWFIDPLSYMLYRQHSNNVVGANSGWMSFVSRSSAIIRGKGFKEVLKQASFIGQTDCIPITLISKSSNRLAMFKLFLLSTKCRRKFTHKILFSMICLLFTIKGH